MSQNGLYKMFPESTLDEETQRLYASIQSYQLEISELHKKIRHNDFDHRQEIARISLALEQETMKNESLERLLTNLRSVALQPQFSTISDELLQLREENLQLKRDHLVRYRSQATERGLGNIESTQSFGHSCIHTDQINDTNGEEVGFSSMGKDKGESQMEPLEQIAILQSRLRESHEKNEVLEQENHSLQKRIDLLMQEIDREEKAMEKRIILLQNELEGRLKENKNLLDDLNNQKEYSASLLEELRSLEKKLETAEREVEQTRSQFNKNEITRDREEQLLVRKSLESPLVNASDNYYTDSQRSKLEHQLFETRKAHQDQITLRNTVIENLEKISSDQTKKITSLELENKRLGNVILTLEMQLDLADQNKKDTNARYQTVIQEFEQKLQEISTRKLEIEMVLKKARDQGLIPSDYEDPRIPADKLVPLSLEFQDLGEKEQFSPVRAFLGKANSNDLITLSTLSRIGDALQEKENTSPIRGVNNCMDGLQQNEHHKKSTKSITSSSPFLNVGAKKSENQIEEEILHKELEKLQKENENLLERLESLEKVNMLERENKNKAERLIQELQHEMNGMRECYHAEVSNHQNHLKRMTNEIVKNALLMNRLSADLEERDSVISRLERYIKVTQSQNAEALNFAREELKRAENEAIEAKVQFAQAASEKDFYSMKVRQYVQLLKRNKIIVDAELERRFNIFRSDSKL